MGFINGLKRLQRQEKGLPGERQKRGDANGGADRRQRLQHWNTRRSVFKSVNHVTHRHALAVRKKFWGVAVWRIAQVEHLLIDGLTADVGRDYHDGAVSQSMIVQRLDKFG